MKMAMNLIKRVFLIVAVLASFILVIFVLYCILLHQNGDIERYHLRDTLIGMFETFGGVVVGSLLLLWVIKRRENINK